MFIDDNAIARLRALQDRPDFSATRYDIDEEIGRGGMGVVFRGRDRALDREVAIKVTSLATSADAERLRAEARTLARLEHPGIVGVHDVGQLPDGRVFTVMTLIRGERLDACALRLPLGDRLRLFDRVCDTVAFAHAHGVVHGDLKPANLMVAAHGRILVVDWGGGATAGYIAPERATEGIDPRADVYALGAILRDLLPPGRGRSLRPLDSIAARAVAADPGARYQSATELGADVRRFIDGAAVNAHRESPVEQLSRLGRTYRMPIALVLAYLAMRGVLLFWGR